MKKLILAASLALATISAYAAPINVTYSYTSAGSGETPPGNAYAFSGAFSGDDADGNGLLSFGELSAWSIFLDEFDLGQRYTLQDLNAFGDFDYRNNVWIANGLTEDRVTHGAYATFADFQFSLAAARLEGPILTTVQDTSAKVPEPASLALMGISLFALGVARRGRRG